ncbi:glycosyltransferase, partial [Vibrio parahaemolyticus]|uniref:glycosyltransferase n=1 Tax=Vibrio parahaemolyticus TaxID=670 RepID=UPI00146AE19A
HYFLERLRGIRNGDVRFVIIGPLEDREYLEECREIITGLPHNVRVEMTGAFERHDDALRRLSECHFFVLPTLNENFGYVFVEAMAAGCPMLISENTVWESAAKAGAAKILP